MGVSEILVQKFKTNLQCIKKTKSLFSTINKHVQTKDIDYVFYITSYATIVNPRTLTSLVNQNKDVCGPLLVKQN